MSLPPVGTGPRFAEVGGRNGAVAPLPDRVPSDGAAGPGGVAGSVLAPPPKLRRRPVLVVASVAAVCLGALLAALAWSSLSTAQDVVAVRRSVERGAVIAREDVMTARVGVDPALKPLPAARLEAVVGQRAAMDLAAGGLVTAESITSGVVPAKGQSVVGVALTAAMMPAQALSTGDRVRIVATPGAQGDVGTADPEVVAATVVGVRAGDASTGTVVDVLVPSPVAARLAARVATGKVALVLDSRER
ncbi:MAG: SAF domain-containing protein [Kineosporiaceae bacterium]